MREKSFRRFPYSPKQRLNYFTKSTVSAQRSSVVKRKDRKKIRGKRVVRGARKRLRHFRHASVVAVAVTGLLIILLAPGEAGGLQEPDEKDIPDTVSIIEKVPTDALIEQAEEKIEEEPSVETPGDIGKAATDEAIKTFNNLWVGFYSNLPKILVAIIVLLLAWLSVRLIRIIVNLFTKRWDKSDGLITILAICIWLFAVGVALSVVAGDIRALVGSLGLIGLALSWALQTPIESFTGWLLNSFQHYYIKGDRIAVGEVFGDVYKIDFLTTTVWEIGAPYKQGFVQAEQPTGRLVTFPNNEILAGTIVNFTRDFPFVWDELSFQVANESDLEYTIQVIYKISEMMLGNYMEYPAQKYSEILRKANLDNNVPVKPQVFIQLTESWTDVVVRYLVGARERRKWKSELALKLTLETSKAEHKGKIIPVYPRQQIQMIKELNNDI